MPNTSKLISYIHTSTNYLLHTFDSNEMISNFLKEKNYNEIQAKLFKELFLTTQLFLMPLPPQNSFGFYLNSQKNNFVFELETNEKGFSRITFNLGTITTTELITDVSCVFKKIEDKGKTITSFNQNWDKNSLYNIYAQIFKNVFSIDAYVRLSSNTNKSILITKAPEIKHYSKIASPPQRSISSLANFLEPITTELLNTTFQNEVDLSTFLKEKDFTLFATKNIFKITLN